MGPEPSRHVSEETARRIAAELEIYSRIKTINQIINANLLEVHSEMELGPGHKLFLDVSKVSLQNQSSYLSSKAFPLVVSLYESKGDEILIDFYSFDNNGICLSHGYSRIQDGCYAVEEAHDTDISRLKEHGKNLEKMLDYNRYLIPVRLLTNTAFLNLGTMKSDS